MSDHSVSVKLGLRHDYVMKKTVKGTHRSKADPSGPRELYLREEQFHQHNSKSSGEVSKILKLSTTFHICLLLWTTDTERRNPSNLNNKTKTHRRVLLWPATASPLFHKVNLKLSGLQRKLPNYPNLYPKMTAYGSLRLSRWRGSLVT